MNIEQRRIMTRAEYFEDVCALAAGCGRGDRIVVATMSFDPADGQVAKVLAALGQAARRGAAVQLIVDAYPYLVHGGSRPGPLFWHADLPERLRGPFRRVDAALGDLRANGVVVSLLNRPRRPFTLPIAGRSHIKFALINDRVYIGGCNLDWHTKVDVMAAWDDPRTAAWLYALAEKMAATGSAMLAAGGEDQTFAVSATDNLLLDAGKRGRSLIFDEALKLIDAARERVFIACQFFPGDVTAKHLLQAHQRGVKVEILYNHASQQAFPHNLLHQAVAVRERRRLPASFFVQSLKRRQPLLHAKVITTEQATIMGSHNFLAVGVRLGTAEIALHSTDPVLGHDIIQSLQQQINA